MLVVEPHENLSRIIIYFTREILVFSETNSKGFALQIMTSSTRLLLINSADNVTTLFLGSKIIVVESVE